MLTDRIERALTLLLVCSAVVVAVGTVHREFFSTSRRREQLTPPESFQSAWRDALKVGVRSGDSSAPVTVVVFSDLECPVCADLHQTLREVVRRHAHEVSTVFVHFPLTMHRFALPAARAAECAGARGRFDQFVDIVYDKQDSLGLKSWSSYASEAGIADTAAIDACARAGAAVPRIQAGRTLGARWAIRGTPTVFINGNRYDAAPSMEDFDAAIRAASSFAARSSHSAK